MRKKIIRLEGIKFKSEIKENVKRENSSFTFLIGLRSYYFIKRSLERRFPWLNSNDIVGGCLGLECEGWFDSWNVLQSMILRNKYLGS